MIDTNIFQNKTAVYYTLGCKLNFSETSTIGKMLKEAGVRGNVHYRQDVEGSRSTYGQTGRKG